ncbi:MAG TPA: hypothetical protein VLE23_00200 [Geminicoccaceae bacterium]|nr:hypothetical protein [Geminicoccaceae bacterium]
MDVMEGPFMSLDRSQKKPQDYQLPAGRRRHEPAFAASDRLVIDGERACPAIPTAPRAAPVDPPAAPAPRDDAPPWRVVALPVVCLLVGLALGMAIGRATAPEALPSAPQQAAPASPASETDDDANATPGAEHPAADQVASEGGSPEPDPPPPDDAPDQ